MPTGSSITVFDGHDSVGGTKILLSHGEERVLLDFGTNYKRMGSYFEEYLNPRLSRGITDLLALQLLPSVRGFYRRDVFPRSDYPRGDEAFAGEAPTAVLLTHAHLDHCGAVGFLDPSIPIYSTPATLAILRAVQESVRGDLPSEITYVSPRAPVGDALVEVDRSSPKRRRDFRLLGESPAALSRLLETPPGARVEIEGPLPRTGTADATVRALGIRAMPVDHSLLGSCAYVLDLDGVRVAYTGDVRFHGGRGQETEEFLRELERRQPDVLLVEGTRLRPSNDSRPQTRTTEEEVRRNATEIVRRYEGRMVIADFGPRNIERLRTFGEIAGETGRQLVVTAKDAYLLQFLHAVDPRTPVDLGPGGMRIWREPRTRAPFAWMERVERWFPGAEITPGEIVAAPGRWVVCFSFFDANDLVDLRAATAGGAWIYSSSEAHGEEQEFDFHRLQRWIEWSGLAPVGFRYDAASGELTFEGGLHASGHATEDELVELVRRSGARRVVPIHSETPGRYRTLLRPEDAELVLPAPGAPIAI